ncbi:hypothetical protein, partial [Fodinibius sp.]|uniref:hypothetical protein n=1 Tax=Fodinibius sp. TaxID=1872440 RepID=UPI003567FC4E
MILQRGYINQLWLNNFYRKKLAQACRFEFTFCKVLCMLWRMAVIFLLLKISADGGQANHLAEPKRYA